MNDTPIVRRIFEMSADGQSLKTIAKTLNSEHVPPPRSRAGKRYATWCPTYIRAMLRRDLYNGKGLQSLQFTRNPIRAPCCGLVLDG